MWYWMLIQGPLLNSHRYTCIEKRQTYLYIGFPLPLSRIASSKLLFSSCGSLIWLCTECGCFSKCVYHWKTGRYSYTCIEIWQNPLNLDKLWSVNFLPPVVPMYMYGIYGLYRIHNFRRSMLKLKNVKSSKFNLISNFVLSAVLCRAMPMINGWHNWHDFDLMTSLLKFLTIEHFCNI